MAAPASPDPGGDAVGGDADARPRAEFAVAGEPGPAGAALGGARCTWKGGGSAASPQDAAAAADETTGTLDPPPANWVTSHAVGAPDATPAVAAGPARSSSAAAEDGRASGGVAAERPRAGPSAPMAPSAEDDEAGWRDWRSWVGLAQDGEILMCLASAHWTCRRCNV
eukprot:10845472-Alexandrium_andersonii.AAC.1